MLAGKIAKKRHKTKTIISWQSGLKETSEDHPVYLHLISLISGWYPHLLWTNAE